MTKILVLIWYLIQKKSLRCYSFTRQLTRYCKFFFSYYYSDTTTMGIKRWNFNIVDLIAVPTCKYKVEVMNFLHTDMSSSNFEAKKDIFIFFTFLRINIVCGTILKVLYRVHSWEVEEWVSSTVYRPWVNNYVVQGKWRNIRHTLIVRTFSSP